MYKRINRSLRLIAIFTLIFSAAFIIAACYTIFGTRLHSEIRSTSEIIAETINAGGNFNAFKDSLEDKRVLIIAPDGGALMSSDGDGGGDNFNGRPEITEARENGRGERSGFSAKRAASVYYYAVRLDDGNILLVEALVNRLWFTFLTILVPLGIAALLIYMLSVSISIRVTENIVRPIEKAYSFGREDYDDVYEEIQPFLKRIAQQNKEIRRNIAELKRAEKIRREFSANVSHELKTPLTSIMGYSQLINSGIAKPEDIPEFTKKIENEASRLLNLIDDIIKLSHLDENDAPAEKTELDLHEAAAACAERLSDIARQRGVTITVEGESAPVRFNGQQLDEMIYNLMDNAVKYNRENGSVTVTTGTSGATGAGSFIRVSDTGIGIPEKYLDRIFERFFRVDKSRSKKISGTGLGLSIVKHIAIINGADITVESEIDKGTSFTVTFADRA